MIQPALYGRIFGMFRRMVRMPGSDIVVDAHGVARLRRPDGNGRMVQVNDPSPIEADIRPILDDNGVVFDDPVHVVKARARNPLGMDADRDSEPGVRFVVPSHYGESSSIGGRSWWDSFGDAVEAARAAQRATTSTDGFVPRAFVHLRMSSSYAPTGTASGIDQVVMQWEVFPDRVVMTVGDCGLTDEQKQAALSLPTVKGGWA